MKLRETGGEASSRCASLFLDVILPMPLWKEASLASIAGSATAVTFLQYASSVSSSSLPANSAICHVIEARDPLEPFLFFESVAVIADNTNLLWERVVHTEVSPARIGGH